VVFHVHEEERTSALCLFFCVLCFVSAPSSGVFVAVFTWGSFASLVSLCLWYIETRRGLRHAVRERFFLLVLVVACDCRFDSACG
jgi:hypothetical protein